MDFVCGFLKREAISFCLTIAPFVAFFLVLGVVGFSALGFSHDPGRAKVYSALEEHFSRNKKVPVSLFDGQVYVSAKDIARGSEIKSDDVASLWLKPQTELKCATSCDGPVVGRAAKRELKKGHLIVPEDLNAQNIATTTGALPKNFDFWIQLIPLCGVTLIALLTYLVGYVWLLKVAFRRNVLWGISCLVFAPFCVARLASRDWHATRKPFMLVLISCCLFGAIGGFAVPAQVAGRELAMLSGEDSMTAEVAKVRPVVYATKHLQAGEVIRATSITCRPLSESKTPQGAISKLAMAVGHRAKYDVEPHQILSIYDIDSKGTH